MMQVHAIDEEAEEVLARRARVIEAYRAAGKIRFVGLTGHTAPAQFQRMVLYDFDTILNPAGPVNVVERLSPRALRRPPARHGQLA